MVFTPPCLSTFSAGISSCFFLLLGTSLDFFTGHDHTAQHTFHTRSFAKANENVSAAHKRGFIVSGAAPRVELCAKDPAWQWQKPKVEISKRALFPAWVYQGKAAPCFGRAERVSFLVKARVLFPKLTFHPAASRHRFVGAITCWVHETEYS